MNVWLLNKKSVLACLDTLEHVIKNPDRRSDSRAMSDYVETPMYDVIHEQHVTQPRQHDVKSDSCHRAIRVANQFEGTSNDSETGYDDGELPCILKSTNGGDKRDSYCRLSPETGTASSFFSTATTDYELLQLYWLFYHYFKYSQWLKKDATVKASSEK